MPRDGHILHELTVSPDFVSEDRAHLFGFGSIKGRKPDFIPDENTEEERARGRITKLQEKYGLECTDESKIPSKPRKAKTGYLDPRNER